MQNYFLVVDTETSGLPKNWKASYTQENNWPHIIQIAWIIYDEHYIEIQRKNHYIKNPDIALDVASQKIHRITHDFLEANGASGLEVMMEFKKDIDQYKPLVIGHFIEFDFHMINVEFSRLGLNDIFNGIDFFCTMSASRPYVRNTSVELLKLNEFYEELFDEAPEDYHNALADTLNTSKIFFHLLKTGMVDHDAIRKQSDNLLKANEQKTEKSRNFINRLFPL